MEKLEVEEGDPVELVDGNGWVVQARTHPNPWVDTRMVSLDQHTMEQAGCRLFGQVKIRKTTCVTTERVTLEAPPGLNVTRRQLRAMLEKAQGAVLQGREEIRLTDHRDREVVFRIRSCEPSHVAQLDRRTAIVLVDGEGQPYISPNETTFDDVGGLQEAIRRVREVVQLPLRHPEIFDRLGIAPPKGVLLYGPSGTGKTLIARAVAGETGCYFRALSGTEIMDKHYGESEAKLRAAFEDAQKNAPAIIFVDEIDALAPRRDRAEGDVEKRITAQLLALMDGMDDRGDLIVLGATNLANVLDSALRRPGRFDREILVGVPDRAGRAEILRIHTRRMPLGEVDLDALADRTHGFVGADIKALCQEAGYKALRRILPGLEATEEPLTPDFLDEITVDAEDFLAAAGEMQPSAARTFEVDLSRSGWDRIAGYEKEKDFLKEMVLWPIRHIGALSGLGVRHLTGLLITGQSGVGKTLMARTLAKETGFNVIEIKGPELISKYMGESERNVRELFRQARQLAPAVVVLDGVDAMTASGWSDSQVMNRVVQQLVSEMNAIAADKPILVLATTHRPDDLPPAVRATGKFATELHLKKPGLADREAMFRMFLNGNCVTFEGDFPVVAGSAEGLTGGDIEEVCRRAIIQAARRLGDDLPVDGGSVPVTENDVIRMLDRWELTQGTHGPAHG
jgi:transitional endoplasmic reticulum ATPase